MGKKKGDSNPAPLVRCLICGETIKVTKWRKHLARFHNINDNPDFRDFFVLLKHLSGSKIKCRLCGQIISLTDWEYHQRKEHGRKDKFRFKDFYISANASMEAANKAWYNPQEEHDLPCGTVISGPPRVKILYNAAFSSRKKF